MILLRIAYLVGRYLAVAETTVRLPHVPHCGTTSPTSSGPGKSIIGPGTSNVNPSSVSRLDHFLYYPPPLFFLLSSRILSCYTGQFRESIIRSPRSATTAITMTVNPELRRQVINIYKGKNLISSIHYHYHSPHILQPSLFSMSRTNSLTVHQSSSISVATIRSDTSTSGIDCIVRSPARRTFATRSRFGRASRGRSL